MSILCLNFIQLLSKIYKNGIFWVILLNAKVSSECNSKSISLSKWGFENSKSLSSVNIFINTLLFANLVSLSIIWSKIKHKDITKSLVSNY